MTATFPSLTAIDRADLILRTDGDVSTWPQNREAQAALKWDRQTLIVALDEHARLLETGFTAHCEDEAEALLAAERQVTECAEALHRTLVRYQRREDGVNLVAARQMAGGLL